MMTCAEKIQTLVRLIVSGHWKKYCELRRREIDQENGMCPDCGDAGECPKCYREEY